MGLINRVASAVWRAVRADRPNEITTSKELDDWLRFGGHETAAGVSVGIENASGLAAVAAAVRILSNAVAHLPLGVYQEDGRRRVPAADQPVYGLLHDKPTRLQTSFQWRKLLMRDLLYRGNAYCLKVSTSRGLIELPRLHPDRVKVKQDERGVVTYEYAPNGKTLVYPRERIFHLWSDSDDGVVGINPIQTYRQSIGDGLALREHGSRFFANAARMGVVLEMPSGAKMSGEGMKQLRSDFDTLYAGGENAHRTALLPGGITAKTVSLSMEDAQWIEARKLTAREIFGIFGIPPHKAGDLADATFSNIEHENLDFVISSLMPWVVCWEQGINRDLLGNAPGIYSKFNTSALLRGDSRSRAEALQIQRRNGIISANEWRDLEDFNPREDAGGDLYVIEQNMRYDDGVNPIESNLDEPYQTP